MTLTYSIGLLLPSLSYYLKLGLKSLTWNELPVNDKNLSSKYLSACFKRFHSACLKYATCNTPLSSPENSLAQFLLHHAPFCLEEADIPCPSTDVMSGLGQQQGNKMLGHMA